MRAAAAQPKLQPNAPTTGRTRPTPKGLWGVLKESAKRWSDDRASRLGAALSYYTAFSMAPLLLLAISVAGLAFGREAAQGQIVGQLSGLIGADSAKMVQDMIQAAQKPAAGIASTVIGVVTLLLGASGVMTELKSALNQIWRVKDSTGLKGFVKTKVRAFGMVLAIGFLLLVSLAVSAGLSAMGKFMGNVFPVPEPVLHVLNIVLSLAVITLLFAILFKYLPDAKILWRDVAIGAAFTSVLFVVGKFALGLYLGKSAASSSYGAAGAVLIMLAWMYYSAQILYFGAEFTRVFSERYGAGVKAEIPDA